MNKYEMLIYWAKYYFDLRCTSKKFCCHKSREHLFTTDYNLYSR